ncbi:hypothetical protein KAX35_05205 [candidate division WOR-3 bacterium]|nr:hypothetical protein [candidate division WOR-3 bacterium]
MHKFILIILSAFVFYLIGLAKTEIAVTNVLKTTDIQQYNRWIHTNRTEYPQPSPIWIKVELTKHGTKNNNYTDEYSISYYDAEGNLVSQEIIEGWILVTVIRSDGTFLYCSPKQPCYGEKIIVNESLDHHMYLTKRKATVKEKNGEIIFSTNNPIGPLGRLLYFRELIESLEILNAKGEVVNLINKAIALSCAGAGFMPWSFTYDGEYGVIQIGDDEMSHSVAVVLIDSVGNEIWRRNFSSGVKTHISDNSLLIAIAEKDKVNLYNRQGELLKIYYPFSPTNVTPTISLSPDGDHLAACSRDEICLYDNISGSLLWRNSLEEGWLPPKQIYLGPEDTYIAVAYLSSNLYLLSYEGDIIEKITLSEEVEEKEQFIPNIGLQKVKVAKSIPFCVFTQNEIHIRRVDDFTVYRIEEQ